MIRDLAVFLKSPCLNYSTDVLHQVLACSLPIGGCKLEPSHLMRCIHTLPLQTRSSGTLPSMPVSRPRHKAALCYSHLACSRPGKAFLESKRESTLSMSHKGAARCIQRSISVCQIHLKREGHLSFHLRFHANASLSSLSSMLSRHL